MSLFVLGYHRLLLATIDLVGDNGESEVWGIFWGVIPISTVHFRGIQRFVGASSFVTLRWVIVCDFKFKRTENHNFTLTTNTSQHVKFFHFLIFHISDYGINSILYQRGIYQPETFTRERKYDLTLLVTTDETLKQYMSEVINQVKCTFLKLMWYPDGSWSAVSVDKNYSTNLVFSNWFTSR